MCRKSNEERRQNNKDKNNYYSHNYDICICLYKFLDVLLINFNKVTKKIAQRKRNELEKDTKENTKQMTRNNKKM